MPEKKRTRQDTWRLPYVRISTLELISLLQEILPDFATASAETEEYVFKDFEDIKKNHHLLVGSPIIRTKKYILRLNIYSGSEFSIGFSQREPATFDEAEIIVKRLQTEFSSRRPFSKSNLFMRPMGALIAVFLALLIFPQMAEMLGVEDPWARSVLMGATFLIYYLVAIEGLRTFLPKAVVYYSVGTGLWNRAKDNLLVTIIGGLIVYFVGTAVVNLLSASTP